MALLVAWRALVGSRRATEQAEKVEQQAENALRQAKGVERRVENLEPRTEGVEERLEDTRGRIESVEGRADASETRAEALASRAQALETQTEALEGELQKLYGRLDRLANRSELGSKGSGKVSTVEQAARLTCLFKEEWGSNPATYAVIKNWGPGAASRVNVELTGLLPKATSTNRNPDPSVDLGVLSNGETVQLTLFKEGNETSPSLTLSWRHETGEETSLTEYL